MNMKVYPNKYKINYFAHKAETNIGRLLTNNQNITLQHKMTKRIAQQILTIQKEFIQQIQLNFSKIFFDLQQYTGSSRSYIISIRMKPILLIALILVVVAEAQSKKVELSTGVANIQRQQLSSSQSIDDLGRRYPQKNGLKAMIFDLDIIQLSSILQLLSSDISKQCQEKFLYLHEMISLLKDKQLQKRQAILEGKDQSARARNKIDEYSAEKAQTVSQKSKIQQEERKFYERKRRLSAMYFQVSSARQSMREEEDRLRGLYESVEAYKNKLSQYTNNISELRVKVDAIIKSKSISASSFEQRLKMESEISNMSYTIKNINASVDYLNAVIAQSEKRVKTLQLMLKRKEGDFDLLYAEANKKKDEGQLIEKRRKQLFQKISNMQRETLRLSFILPNLKYKMQEEQLKLVRVQQLIIIARTEIRRYQYLCYGEKVVKQINQRNQVLYLMKKEFFPKYISNIYNISTLLKDAELKFLSVEVGSQLWMKQFGIDQDVILANLYSCQSLQGLLISGQGFIEDIGVDRIVVQDKTGAKVDLHIQGCSLIQSTTDMLQKKQTIFWKGSASKKGGYSLFLATCL